MAAGDDAAAVELDAADAARVALERPHVALAGQPATTQLVPLPDIKSWIWRHWLEVW